MDIKDYRINVLGKTQEQIAAKAKCSQTTISRIEDGEAPNPFGIPRFLRAYKLDRAEFLRLIKAALSRGGKCENERAGMRDAEGVPKRSSKASADRHSKAGRVQTGVDIPH